MTKKQLEELQKAHLNEFMTKEEDNLRQSARQMNNFINIMVEEGFTRQEAIIFIANSCRPQ